MINHIAYLNSFKDKNKIPPSVFFNKYVFSYEKDRLLNIICSKNDNHLFFISTSFLEFRSLFFKMGIIYKIFKKYGFHAEVEINKAVYKISNFSDYYDIFENCNDGYVTVNFDKKKFNFTFIDPIMKSSYLELLSDFFKFNRHGYGINFIYSLNESRNSFTQILDFYKKLIDIGDKKNH